MSHLEIDLQTELTAGQEVAVCRHSTNACSSEQALQHPLAGTFFHPLGFTNQHCQLLHHFHQPPAVLHLWVLQLTRPNLTSFLLSRLLHLPLHLQLLPRLISHLDNAIFPSKNNQPHFTLLSFLPNSTFLAHLKTTLFSYPHTLCFLLITSNKSNFCSFPRSSRANHSLIHYLCLLPPSISPSCFLSSHTRRFQTPFVLSSVLYLIQRRGQPASYLIDLFQILLSNLLCLHTKAKLSIPVGMQNQFYP